MELRHILFRTDLSELSLSEKQKLFSHFSKMREFNGVFARGKILSATGKACHLAIVEMAAELGEIEFVSC